VTMACLCRCWHSCRHRHVPRQQPGPKGAPCQNMQPPLLATIQHWLLTALHCSLPATLDLTSLFAIKGLRRIVAARLIGQSSLGGFSHSAEQAHIG